MIENESKRIKKNKSRKTRIPKIRTLKNRNKKLEMKSKERIIKMASIILASASPRRREILEQVGIKFSILVSEKEERTEEKSPKDFVTQLSKVKAEDVLKRVEGNAVIIGADTVVAHSEQILGKPKSQEEAVRMLKQLQGNMHQVYTGVCIIIKKENKIEEISFVEQSDVVISSMTEEQIKAYVATKESMDKAGAYAIQGKFALYVEQIKGDYYNIVGLPISRIYRELLKKGIRLI